MHTCKIHDMPIGVLATKPHVGKQDYTIFFSSRFYNTTEAACRTDNGGFLHFRSCVIRDNKHIGLDVGAGSKQHLHLCRIAHNRFSIVIRPAGLSTVEDSIINQNGIGINITSGGEIDVVYCRIENHTGIAVLFEEGSKGRIADTLFRSNAAGDMQRHPLAEIEIVGDLQRDYLGQRMRRPGSGIKIPLE